MALLLALTLLNVGLQLASAALIKFATLRDPALVFLMVVLGIVLALNFSRFLVWNVIHKRYPVSFAYPLSALFFPAVVLLAWLSGERVGPWQIVGASLVMAGTTLIVLAGGDKPDNADQAGTMQ
jgi:drug/metabolite transporter (DMT)-like permease